jgi:hypothetical protein
MNEKIINHIEKISFQIRNFLRTNHKFDDLIFVDIKNFVSNVIKNKNSSIISKSTQRTRSSKSSNTIIWSQIWAIDRDEFKKIIVNFKKVVELFFNFSKDHSKESFKNIINFAIESFVTSKLILSESFSFLTRASTNIANQIVNARNSSSLISIFSSFENSANIRSFSKFDFTSRFYETFSANFAFSTSRTSNVKSTRSNSILDFVENSKHSTAAKSFIIEFAKSISVLHFVLRSSSASQIQSAKSTNLNSKSSSFEQFSSRSITSESNKQTIRTSTNYEISRIISAVESSSAFNMSQEFLETQRRELMTMMQEFWTQRSINSAFSQTQQSSTMNSKSKR